MDRIVFIDDDRFYAARWIEKLREAFEVTHFADAREARNHIARSRDLACLIVDVMMPTPDDVSDGETNNGFETGIWLLSKLQSQLIDQPLPALILTNRDVAHIRDRIDDLKFPEGLIEIRRKLDTGRETLLSAVKDVISKWKNC